MLVRARTDAFLGVFKRLKFYSKMALQSTLCPLVVTLHCSMPPVLVDPRLLAFWWIRVP